MLPPLHGTLDLHDGVAVVAVAATLMLWTQLALLRERMRRNGRAKRTADEDVSGLAAERHTVVDRFERHEGTSV